MQRRNSWNSTVVFIYSTQTCSDDLMSSRTSSWTYPPGFWSTTQGWMMGCDLNGQIPERSAPSRCRQDHYRITCTFFFPSPVRARPDHPGPERALFPSRGERSVLGLAVLKKGSSEVEVGSGFLSLFSKLKSAGNLWWNVVLCFYVSIFECCSAHFPWFSIVPMRCLRGRSDKAFCRT